MTTYLLCGGILFWLVIIGRAMFLDLRDALIDRTARAMRVSLRDGLMKAHPRMRAAVLQTILDDWCPVCGESTNKMGDCYHVRISTRKSRSSVLQ